MNKSKRLIFFALILTMLLSRPAFIFGQSNPEDNEEVKKINQDIQAKKDKIKKMQEEQESYAAIVKQKQGEKADLGNQLSILDNRLAMTELEISSVQVDIERTNLEIQKTNIEITNKNSEIEKNKERLEIALKLIQKQDETDALKIILLNDSLSEFLNQEKYLEDINKAIGESLDTVKENKRQLEKNIDKLNEQNKSLLSLKKEIEDKKTMLISEKEDKVFILDQTKSSEVEYQKLLSQAKTEQRNAASDIADLERLAREKIEQLSKKQIKFVDAGFIWPVPQNTITALFHDPGYPFRYIFEHPAVDIRAKQGTPIRAAASGYVARAKDAGNGYSYIMLIHGNNLSTVYGHVSQINVAEDEYVTQGQIIGLSGGMPGTPGAGRLTTGSHLHFEVRSNGIPVDPLEYLPQ